MVEAKGLVIQRRPAHSQKTFSSKINYRRIAFELMGLYGSSPRECMAIFLPLRSEDTGDNGIRTL